MSLLNMAPDIQEALLFLPQAEDGRDSMTTERQIRGLMAEVDYGLGEAADDVGGPVGKTSDGTLSLD